MSKKYEISTVQDMIDCTNEENLDNFLIDLKCVITSAHAINELGEIVTEINDLPTGKGKVRLGGFIWIDDGKHEGKITIGTK